MVFRSPDMRTLKSETLGAPQLILAKVILFLEKKTAAYAAPILIAGMFVALAWLGTFSALRPWAHLAALIIFTVFFFDAMRAARSRKSSVNKSEARRRVEEASELFHRPFDVLEDRPVTRDPEQLRLWQAHVARTKEQLRKLRFPRWTLSFADRDPYALRYALLILLAVGGFFSWGLWGGRLMAAINPSLGRELNFAGPPLDAWITPPEYTGLPPIMISTPAGPRQDGDTDVVEVPEGSVITAHLAEKDGEPPTLTANGRDTAFAENDHNDFEAAAAITDGDTIKITRGWHTLGSWHIKIIRDQPPQIAFGDKPASTERKTVKVSYEAQDDYGVDGVAVRITPKESVPGAGTGPLDIMLSAPKGKNVTRTTFVDLTSHPWAGLPVEMQLFVKDAKGQIAETPGVEFTLPERTFLHPLARALIEERKKLMQKPDDEATRNETANIMAGIARQPAAYRGDPLVLLALRTGAVRLVLNKGNADAPPVSDLLWQAAIRIEDGAAGMAQEALRQAQQDLADALDRNASEQEVQKLIDRLHMALAQYLAQLASQMAQQPPPQADNINDLDKMTGPQTNMLTPDDLHRLLEEMRTLSASGERDEARQELSKLQQLLENLRFGPPKLTEAQKAMMQAYAEMQGIKKKQQQLLDQTFRNAQSGNDPQSNSELRQQQESLRQQLQALMDKMGKGKGGKGETPEGMGEGEEAMTAAGNALSRNAGRAATEHQNDALNALQKSLDEMGDALRSSMMGLPAGAQDAMGEDHDPFGRLNYGGRAQDDGSVKVPDQLETRRVRQILMELQRRSGDGSRSRTEREYIDRLLQNF